MPKYKGFDPADIKSYDEYRVLVRGVEDRPKKKTVRVRFPDGYVRHVKV
jgi:hypothetical protein